MMTSGTKAKYSIITLVLLTTSIFLSFEKTNAQSRSEVTTWYGFVYIESNIYLSKNKNIKALSYVSPVVQYSDLGNYTDFNKQLEKEWGKKYEGDFRYLNTGTAIWKYQIVGKSFLSISQAEKERSSYINEYKDSFLKYGDFYEVEEFPEFIIPSSEKALENKSDILREEAFFNNIDIDGMKVSGSFTVKAKFVFMGYPYIVAEYDDLTIDEIKYKNESYSITLNTANKYLSLPYKVKSKPSMNVVCYVWTPKVKNPRPLTKEHYKIFNYPINGLASITDHYDNDEADKHFKSFDYDDEHDSFFWTRSVFRKPKQDVMGDLETIKVTSISLTLKQELEKKLKTYLYEKDRDFWGNKKDKSKPTKKTKKDDDFWN